MPSGGAARRPLETRWAAAGSEVLAKRDAAPLRRAHQQAASRRALAISTHATPATPSETSSAHLAQRGRVSAQMFGVGVRRKAGRREWRTDHEDVCACLPKGRRRRRRPYRPRCHPATPVATEPVEPSIDKSAGKERGGGQLPKTDQEKKDNERILPYLSLKRIRKTQAASTKKTRPKDSTKVCQSLSRAARTGTGTDTMNTTLFMMSTMNCSRWDTHVCGLLSGRRYAP